MTILMSRLVTPDGKAIVGRKVTATLMHRPSWITSIEGGGRALGSVTGYTDAEGIWRIKLMPVDEFEDDAEQYVWYQIDEGGDQTWRVRFDSNAGKELWLKDHLIDPPPPAPDYIAIDKLGSLHDVDSHSVDGAPNGAMLVKRDGRWVAEMPTFGKQRLAELNDVDESATWASAGDELIYLGANLWGTIRYAPIDVHYGADDPFTLWFETRQHSTGYEFEYHVTGMDTWQRWADLTSRLRHTFPTAGTYLVQVRYLGIEPAEQDRTAWGTNITIPFEEPA